MCLAGVRSANFGVEWRGEGVSVLDEAVVSWCCVNWRFGVVWRSEVLVVWDGNWRGVWGLS